jgi:hypothetical protein
MDHNLTLQLKRQFEEKTGWGDSDLWNNQDFLELSVMIFEQTGIALSHVTLKRIWGKVRYESLPHTKTLNTIVQFLGYRCWREFYAKNNSLILCSSNHSQKERNKGNNKQNVDNTAGMIAKESDSPTNNQDYCNDVEDASHGNF